MLSYFTQYQEQPEPLHCHDKIKSKTRQKTRLLKQIYNSNVKRKNYHFGQNSFLVSKKLLFNFIVVVVVV